MKYKKEVSVIADKKLEQLIKSRINYTERHTNSNKGAVTQIQESPFSIYIEKTYDGFDMTGYNKYRNMKLLGRFADILSKEEDSGSQQGNFIFPWFHKGSLQLQCITENTISTIDFSSGEKGSLDDDKFVGGETTVDILKKIIFFQNPDFVKKLEDVDYNLFS
jgi:hypothetical protein